MKKVKFSKEFEETFTVWRMVDHIETPEDVFVYIEGALEEDDPQFMLKILGYVAQSKGMAQLAKELKVPRKRLCASLPTKGNPSFKTVADVLKSFGFQLTVKPLKPLKKSARLASSRTVKKKIAVKKNIGRKIAA